MSNRTVIFMVGIPGSGKSTWTNAYMKNNPETIVLSRDSLRSFLGSADELMVTHWMNDMFERSLYGEKTIIIDNTNLRRAYIRPFIDKIRQIEQEYSIHWDVRFKIIDTPLNVCLERNGDGENARPKEQRVPKDVILKMHKQFKSFKDNIPSILSEFMGELL